MAVNTPIKNHCRNCCVQTNHSVLSGHNDSERGDENFDIIYQIVECLGCNTRTFRKVFIDYDSAYPTEEDEWEVPQEVECFPKSLNNHSEIEKTYYLSSSVRRIYQEVLSALKEEAYILSGMGLRGIVEAVCNDLKVDGKNLESKINKLASTGYISKKDAERLHGIRFMGNDAAHEITKPKEESVRVALRIVEHLLHSVYILENEAGAHIDTVISEYKLFEKLIMERLNQYNSGDEIPLAEILGKDIRRIRDSFQNLEKEMLSKITSGEFKPLAAGKIDIYKNSQQPLQHFIVA